MLTIVAIEFSRTIDAKETDMLFRVIGLILIGLGGFCITVSLCLGFDLLYFICGLLLVSAGWRIGRLISYEIPLDPKLATWVHGDDQKSTYQIQVGGQMLVLGGIMPSTSGAYWFWARTDIGDLSDQWIYGEGCTETRQLAQVRVMQGWS